MGGSANDYNDQTGAIYLVFEFMDHDLGGLLNRGVEFTAPEVMCISKQVRHCTDGSFLLPLPNSYGMMHTLYRELVNTCDDRWLTVGCGRVRVICAYTRHGMQILTGLHYIHAQKVLHRDMKVREPSSRYDSLCLMFHAHESQQSVRCR